MPKFGIMSDIHSNLAALTEALSIFQQHRVDRIYCIGDIVGYGTEPEECCTLVRAAADAVVAGNHDLAVCNRIDYLPIFSPAAIVGVQYSKKFLMDSSVEWLCDLPLTYEDAWLQMAHGSLEQPDQFYYLRNSGSPDKDIIYQEVALTFDRMTRPACFVGHTHEPLMYIEECRGRIATLAPSREAFCLGGRRAVINAGSIGTPRGRDKRGCAVIYDSDRNTILFENFSVSPSSIPEWIARALDWPE